MISYNDRDSDLGVPKGGPAIYIFLLLYISLNLLVQTAYSNLS